MRTCGQSTYFIRMEYWGESQQPFRHLLFRETGYCAADLFIQDSSVPLGIWGGCSAPVC